MFESEALVSAGLIGFDVTTFQRQLAADLAYAANPPETSEHSIGHALFFSHWVGRTRATNPVLRPSTPVHLTPEEAFILGEKISQERLRENLNATSTEGRVLQRMVSDLDGLTLIELTPEQVARLEGGTRATRQRHKRVQTAVQQGVELPPIILKPLNESGRVTVYDGHTRVTVAQRIHIGLWAYVPTAHLPWITAVLNGETLDPLVLKSVSPLYRSLGIKLEDMRAGSPEFTLYETIERLESMRFDAYTDMDSLVDLIISFRDNPNRPSSYAELENAVLNTFRGRATDGNSDWLRTVLENDKIDLDEVRREARTLLQAIQASSLAPNVQRVYLGTDAQYWLVGDRLLGRGVRAIPYFINRYAQLTEQEFRLLHSEREGKLEHGIVYRVMAQLIEDAIARSNTDEEFERAMAEAFDREMQEGVIQRDIRSSLDRRDPLQRVQYRLLGRRNVLYDVARRSQIDFLRHVPVSRPIELFDIGRYGTQPFLLQQAVRYFSRTLPNNQRPLIRVRVEMGSESFPQKEFSWIVRLEGDYHFLEGAKLLLFDRSATKSPSAPRFRSGNHTARVAALLVMLALLDEVQNVKPLGPSEQLEPSPQLNQVFLPEPVLHRVWKAVTQFVITQLGWKRHHGRMARGGAIDLKQAPKIVLDKA